MLDLSNVDDGELVRLLKMHRDNGDVANAALREVMRRYRRLLTMLVSGRLRGRLSHDVDEVVDTAFIRAYSGVVNFRGDSTLKTWLYRIVINLAHNRYWYHQRRHARDTISLDMPVVDGESATLADVIEDPEVNVSAEVDLHEQHAVHEAALARLDARDRTILVMRNVENRSYKEIAAALNIHEGTVKSRISRSREKLRAEVTGLTTVPEKPQLTTRLAPRPVPPPTVVASPPVSLTSVETSVSVSCVDVPAWSPRAALAGLTAGLVLWRLRAAEAPAGATRRP